MIGYIGAQGEQEQVAGRRRGGAMLAVSFFLGVTGGLLVLGTAAALFGRLLARWSVIFALATALVSILMGTAAIFGPLLRRYVANPNVKRRGGVGGAFVYGLLFTVATLTTTAGPLMLLLTIAAAVGKPLYGALLSLAYGAGRGLPFLFAGLFAERLTGRVTRFDRGRRAAELASGVALIGVGAYFLQLAPQLG